MLLFGLVTMIVTAYSPDCKGCSGVMASGERADPSAHTVAADTRYYALGTCLHLHIPGGRVTVRVTDRGGAIKGPARLDLLVPTQASARAWGVQEIQAHVVACPK
jgi:3D (Asp-Asp-Asp) domain-containing protein